ncbi:1,4-dihydroxy-2-naphthoate octaprenyltransferase [Psychromonas sp. MB-3u-54]|uniref:1,4-dihydroxy-2-naphthoate octaprenyltransferase n=1 Tax=Psychromonas sp. MB-3u-54 TaxID=2058319 RepID=UPI000C337C38|nr:1,4-dihydroxy-2-naphthoate octaprenyltransferase [Psychromonas sp. MB-3u-54]PKH01628.1 1,4-dihydroxy-2-naphthoate octaprenyltransferase [Psychromonas sp. MB-3u-54]
MSKVSVWLSELRLRTLPLAAASIILGAGLAIHAQIFDLLIFSLSLITALLLQILSNLANDYGDAISGVDNGKRVGPLRAMQSGAISRKSLKIAILLTTFLVSVSGMTLLVVALGSNSTSWVVFLVLGLLAIVAAITYTMGKLHYGYRAMGDLAVFLFFGLVGVVGSYYLYGLTFSWSLLLPATSVGLLSAAVLNINNMRDMYTDKEANKTTLVVLWGRRNAFIYHLSLIVAAGICSISYFSLLENVQAWQFIFLLSFSPLIKSCLALKEAIFKDIRDGQVFNDELKNTALSTFVFSLLFAVVLIAMN